MGIPQSGPPRDSPDESAPSSEARELDALFNVAYEELRRLASFVRRNDVNATLSPTTLVNEAWLRLAKAGGASPESQLHFKRIAARAMRQIVIEAARRRIAQKRGGTEVFVSFGDSSEEVAACGQEVLAVDAALKELARLNPRQAAIVEARFFGGLEVAETAELLNLSEATILRDWRSAKAWLAAEIRNARR